MGLYYLRSRYYDPEVCRFLNADAFVSTGQGIIGYNMFAYCNNNPVNGVDPGGSKMISVSYLSDGGGERKIVQYDVDCFHQKDTNLCWAYCMVMRNAYINGETITEEEAFNRAKRLGEKYHPILGWNTGLPFFMQGKKAEINSIDDLYDLLEEYGPIYVAYKKPKSLNGHIVLITGVDVDRWHVYTNNPWGVKGEQSYSQFLDGFVNIKNEQVEGYSFYNIYLPTS